MSSMVRRFAIELVASGFEKARKLGEFSNAASGKSVVCVNMSRLAGR